MLIFKVKVNLPKSKLHEILLAAIAPLKCNHIKLVNGIRIIGNFKEVEWSFYYIMATGYELIIEPISENESILNVIGETYFSPIHPPKHTIINVDDTLMPIICEIKEYINNKEINIILFITLLISSLLSIPGLWVIYQLMYNIDISEPMAFIGLFAFIPAILSYFCVHDIKSRIYIGFKAKLQWERKIVFLPIIGPIMYYYYINRVR